MNWSSGRNAASGAKKSRPLLGALERIAGAHPLLAALFPVVKHSLLYLAGAILVGLGNFVLVPLYTRCLTSSDFGAYALLEISLLITVTATQMGLSTTYLRWYSEIEPERRGEILASSIVAGFSAALFGGTMLAALVASPLGEKWLSGNGNAQCAWLLLPLVLLRNAQGIFFSSLQATQSPVAYGLCAVARLFALVGAGCWFVAVHREGVLGVLRGLLVGDGVCVLALLIACLPGMRLRVRRATLAPMLRYGLPLVWSALMALVLDAAGRYFLARFQSLAEVGRYAVGIKITSILSLGFLQPFASGWAGSAFPIAHRPNAPITYTKILGYALIVAALLAAITVLFGPWLIRIFAGPMYFDVQPLLPWLLLPVVFRLLEYWSSLPIHLAYKTKWLGPLATVSTGLCIFLNYLLVPRWGALGSAVAWSSAIASGVLLMTAFGRRYYPLPFDLSACALAAVMWLLAAGIGRWALSHTAQQSLEASVVASALLLLTCALYFRWDIRTSRSLFKAEEAYAAD
jgi:O-antigen/teichoic acid export membrane protein